MFATFIRFHPCLICVGKAGAHSNGGLLALPTNIKLRWKWQTSFLRYGNNCGRKKFYSTGPWAQSYMHFMGVIYSHNKISRCVLLAGVCLLNVLVPYLPTSINYACKLFITLTPELCFIKLFHAFIVAVS